MIVHCASLVDGHQVTGIYGRFGVMVNVTVTVTVTVTVVLLPGIHYPERDRDHVGHCSMRSAWGIVSVAKINIP